MDPAAATVTLDRDAFNTFWVVWLALLALAFYEWNDIVGPQPKADPKGCPKHPGTDYCKCRGTLPPGKR